jgi:hypothetical protein
MPYIIDRSNPAFPIIVEAGEGDAYQVLAVEVAAHHLEAATDHLRALGRLLGTGGTHDPEESGQH